MGFVQKCDGAEKSSARSRIDFLGQGFIRFLEKGLALALWENWRFQQIFCRIDGGCGGMK